MIVPRRYVWGAYASAMLIFAVAVRGDRKAIEGFGISMCAATIIAKRGTRMSKRGRP